MSEQSNPTTTPSPEPVRPRRGRRWLFVTTVALVAAISGAMATRAVGHYGPHGWSHMRGGPWSMRGPLSAAEIEDRTDRAVPGPPTAPGAILLVIAVLVGFPSASAACPDRPRYPRAR
jgi:hypothetical protein